ncbi:hypothetical protein AKI39_14645 [Bordetella sp. H567]|uniref:hypothetical protein n=1 Tax=Bordetella sp. H567 TaxID=1697043 RepID=UPI00081CEAEE|nr:hypothetical protein [Bordetella sp. H567]AOB31663.1 hypothetical protein AKI39_14645 [Bordetella sp. H567]
MKIEEVIRREFQRYVDFFTGSKAILEEKQPDIQSEPLIALKNEEPYPYRYIRPDLMSEGADGKMRLHLVHQGPDPGYQTICYDCGAFRLDIHPFAWSDIQLIFDKPPTDMAQIDDWITRWMDVEDTGSAAHSGLTGAVHHFYQVEQHPQHKELWTLMGDLGTAPPDALIELVELLGTQGMSHIVLAGTGV